MFSENTVYKENCQRVPKSRLKLYYVKKKLYVTMIQERCQLLWTKLISNVLRQSGHCIT